MYTQWTQIFEDLGRDPRLIYSQKHQDGLCDFARAIRHAAEQKDTPANQQWARCADFLLATVRAIRQHKRSDRLLHRAIEAGNEAARLSRGQ